MPYMDHIDIHLSEKDLVFKWLTEDRISFEDLSNQYIKYLYDQNKNKNIYRFFEM